MTASKSNLLFKVLCEKPKAVQVNFRFSLSEKNISKTSKYSFYLICSIYRGQSSLIKETRLDLMAADCCSCQ